MLFLTNPMSTWVSSVQGQSDNLSLLFLLAAVLVYGGRERRDQRTALRTGFLLFLSVAAKQVTLFHPILWLRRRRGLAIALIAYLATAALFLPYAGQWRAILDRLLLYGSVPRSYGFSEFVLYDHRWEPFVGALAAALAAAWALGKQRLPRACLLLFLVILIFAPGLWLAVPDLAARLRSPVRWGALPLFQCRFDRVDSRLSLRGPRERPVDGASGLLSAGLWAIGELRGLENPGRFAKILRGETPQEGNRVSPNV